jgi:hypothetical protein
MKTKKGQQLCFLTFLKVISRNGDTTFIGELIISYNSLYLKDNNDRLNYFFWIQGLLFRPEDLGSHSWALHPNIKISYQTKCNPHLATERVNDGSWQVSQTLHEIHIGITKDDE